LGRDIVLDRALAYILQLGCSRGKENDPRIRYTGLKEICAQGYSALISSAVLVFMTESGKVFTCYERGSQRLAATASKQMNWRDRERRWGFSFSFYVTKLSSTC